MGGIAGWLDFERDLSTYRGVVLAQLGTLAPRGPDGEGVFVAPHLVAGHRARAVVERGRASQPVSVRGPGGGRATLLLDGQVYNWRELRAELAAAGHEFTGGGDAEVVAHAYLRWGPAFAEHLDGMFAIAVWDATRERLLLVRDRLGVKPLFYQRVGGGLTFGSEPKALLAHPLADREVDADGLRELLAFTSTPGRAVFRGMRRVLPGGVVEAGRDGTTEHRYWELTAAPHPDDRDATVARVRELLGASVARQLGADTPPAVLLSGGVDSSTVAALAARELTRRGEGPLRTYTIGYPGGGPGTPGPMRSAEDAPFAAEVAAHLGAEHTYLELDPAELLDPVARGSAVAAQQDMPVAAPQFPASLRLLCRRIAVHSGVVLAGEQADTVFASFMGMDDPTVIGADTYPWIAATRDRLPPAGLGTGLLAPDLLAKLDVPGYLADTYRADLARVPRLDAEDPAEARLREIYFLHLQGWQEFGCALDDGVSAAEGVELRWPFCDHRLVQYLYNVPWSLKTSGGPKGLLRAAVADLLPASVLTRPSSQFPTGRNPAYAGSLRREAAEVLADPHAPVRRLLDVPAVQRALRAPFDPARAWRDLTDLEMVLQLNQWLTNTAARLSL
ncbi:asparagine synthase (glutamine-hydrolyzing) [Micromonospora sp. NPDC048170]|uniref:asparagine synthase (glutamine-hydrolyzing) n=1 Tax=Micromonospora sp. NPDC048170 TaxID=3154819 RepID=UPI00340AADB7